MRWVGLLRIGTEAELVLSIRQMETKTNPNQLLEILVLMLSVQKIAIFTLMLVDHQTFIPVRNFNQVLCHYYHALGSNTW